jgi:UPF0755 protein
VSRARLAGVTAAGLLLLSLAAAGWGAAGLRLPIPLAGARDFHVAPGDTLSSIAERLDAEELLPRRLLFGPRVLVLAGRALGIDRQLKSGEYEIAPGITPLELLEKIVSGAVKTYAVTLPEGLRLDEIAGRLAAPGIVGADEFLAAVRSREFARALGVEADTLEGYLYPETYRFPRGSAPAEVARRMLEELRSRWTEEDQQRLAVSRLTLHQILTLASIVEKETAVPAERALIGAVFRNRLTSGMRLQSDPTVIYGVLETRGSFNGNLTRSDLERDSRYNTYTRDGIPPGPIASTGMESIRAVLQPANVSYRYFVSRNDGTHEFSTTLAEHARAVSRYQMRRPNPS